jgi:CubicO group peptidase (beta-lactamase class C family)
LPPYNAFFDSLQEKFPDGVFTNADFLPGLAAKRLPLIYPPGAKGNYDNVNYIVIALVLEKVSGESYRSNIDKHILKPAGMTRTRFMPLSYQYTVLKSSGAFSYPRRSAIASLIALLSTASVFAQQTQSAPPSEPAAEQNVKELAKQTQNPVEISSPCHCNLISTAVRD